jgi:hypothetical protein
MTLRSLLLAALLTLSLAAPAFANKAETMLIPTRVVMENGQRYATLVVKNTGDASGQYTIETVDMVMHEDGSVTEVPEGETPQFPAAPLVHISPRSVTLKPGEDQTVRILVRKPETLEAGEYRSHIKVRVVNDNVEQTEAPPTGDAAAIQIRANLVLVIPLIVRNGETSVKATLTEPHLTTNPETGERQLDVYINREGNLSTMGNLKVYRDGTEVAALDGVPVYRPTARRIAHIPFKDVQGNGPFTIRYLQQDVEGPSAVMAETTLR